MNIIFLDIDGVLNSTAYMKRFCVCGDGYFTDVVDPNIVKLFTEFLDKHEDIKLVITSSWRYDSVQETIKFFETTGLREINDYIVGVTPRLLYVCGRGDEIKWFINHINSDVIGDFVNDDFEIDHYVIVDDETFDILDEQKQHLIHVDNNTGLTEDNIKEIENKLYGQL